MAIRVDDSKLVSNGQRKQKRPNLYDLNTDMGEQNNLRAMSPEKVSQLQQEWDEWNSQLKPCIFPNLREDKWWEK